MSILLFYYYCYYFYYYSPTTTVLLLLPAYYYYYYYYLYRVNIDPAAFVIWGGAGPGGGSPLPVHFKFRIALECPPISLMDPELVCTLLLRRTTTTHYNFYY